MTAPNASRFIFASSASNFFDFRPVIQIEPNKISRFSDNAIPENPMNTGKFRRVSLVIVPFVR